MRFPGATLLLALVAAGCGAPPPATSGTGERIVSLAPSITETVFALGEGGRLVGVCGQCDYPEAAARLPRVGGYLAPSVEAVLALQPDLVIAVPSPGNREAVRAIERAGVRVLVVADRTLDDMWASIRSVAETLRVGERGEALVREITDGLAAVHRRVEDQPPRRVLLVVGHRPLIVAGGGTLQDELLRTAGGLNVAADVGEAFPQVSLEVVVARAPEVILDAAMGTEQGSRALWSELRTVPAVREGRIVSVSADALFRAGPRVTAAAAALAAAIHPDVAAAPGSS